MVALHFYCVSSASQRITLSTTNAKFRKAGRPKEICSKSQMRRDGIKFPLCLQHHFTSCPALHPPPHSHPTWLALLSALGSDGQLHTDPIGPTDFPSFALGLQLWRFANLHFLVPVPGPPSCSVLRTLSWHLCYKQTKNHVPKRGILSGHLSCRCWRQWHHNFLLNSLQLTLLSSSVLM